MTGHLEQMPFLFIFTKNSMSTYVIGVDIGTGSTKAVAVNPAGKAVSTALIHYPTLHPTEGHCEQDPEVVWQAFVSGISKITSELKTSPEAIIFSSAMHSVIPVTTSGEALMPMIIWADNRSSEIATRIKQSSMGELLYEQNGTPIHAMSPLCKIIWLRENRRSVFEKTHKFISIKEYLWFRLFHDFEVDHSIASATGMMNIESSTWNTNALNLAEIEEQKLSRLVPTNHMRSNADFKTCSKLGIGQKTIFIIGASDGCFANLGSFATAPGVAALTIGTSGAVRVASKKPVFNFQAMTFNYRLNSETFICGGPSNNGGVALKWYVENFLGKTLQTASDYDAILKSLNDSKPGASGLIFLPYLFGERAPLWNSDATACFFGIRGQHTQADFTRAVIEGISMALYDIADSMMNAGLTIDRIHVSGGFVRSTPWLKIIANIFNKKICLLNTDDASALGAAYLGLKTLEMIDDYSSIQTTMQEINPEPNINTIYQKSFQYYRKLNHQLHFQSIQNNLLTP
jgi:gluconokinase